MGLAVDGDPDALAVEGTVDDHVAEASPVRVRDMATVILVRHGRTSANATGTLAGRLPGVRLDDVGEEQAARTAERIAAVPLAAVVTSPLERCRQTARILAQGHPGSPRVATDKGITECDYGEWQGRPLKELAREKLWATVQSQPSAATFPGGESLAAMQARAVAAVRRHDAAVEEEHGASAVWVAVTHGDIVKSVLADALGMHLDLFQRLAVDPASVSVDPLHRHPPLRPGHQHPCRRPVLAGDQAVPEARAAPGRPRRWRRRSRAVLGVAFGVTLGCSPWHPSSTDSTRRSASSPGPSACRASARSSSRPARARG